MTEQTTTTEPQDSVQVDLDLRMHNDMSRFILDAVNSMRMGRVFAIPAIADPSTTPDGVEGYQVALPPFVDDPDALAAATEGMRAIAEGLDRAAAQLTTTTPKEG